MVMMNVAPAHKLLVRVLLSSAGDSVEGREHLDPLSAHGAGVGVAGHGVRVRGGGGGRGGGAPGEGEGEAAVEGIEVRALGQGQESLVTET